MNPFDAFWHIVNFFAPAVGVGYLAAGASKLLWRHELATTGWLRLGAWASAAMAAASAAGLVIFEHDGKIATYAAMIVACAIALWWTGFRDRR
ncbi:MAG: hypothetical protein ACXWCV_07595 [Caldimonas sp.]